MLVFTNTDAINIGYLFKTPTVNLKTRLKMERQ